QKPDIVDLRDAWSKELKGACDQVLVIAAAQSFVKGAIDLIEVKIVGGCSGGLPARAPAPLMNGFQEMADFFRRKQARLGRGALAARPNIEDSDTIVRVQHGDCITRTNFEPVFQLTGIARVERMQD